MLRVGEKPRRQNCIECNTQLTAQVPCVELFCEQVILQLLLGPALPHNLPKNLSPVRVKSTANIYRLDYTKAYCIHLFHFFCVISCFPKFFFSVIWSNLFLWFVFWSLFFFFCFSKHWRNNRFIPLLSVWWKQTWPACSFIKVLLNLGLGHRKTVLSLSHMDGFTCCGRESKMGSVCAGPTSPQIHRSLLQIGRSRGISKYFEKSEKRLQNPKSRNGEGFYEKKKKTDLFFPKWM